MGSDHIHVVSKQGNTRHAVCKLTGTQPRSQLAPSSVRVRVEIISLSSNNLSYARGGTILHWWDAYPVPEDAPPPFNDASEWGIVPAWGFARVTDATIPSIPVGSHLWGMWPTSSHSVDLQLEPVDSAASGLWAETSPHRSSLMTMYNHYQYIPADKPLDDTFAAFRCLFPVFESGHLLNQAVFPAASSAASASVTTSPVHPLGLPHLPWTEENADLTGAVVVSLSAASKTGRSLAWQLARNRDRAGGDPVALLQLTSSPRTLASFAESDDQTPSLAIKSAAYTDPIDEAVSWIREAAPTRVVVLDFGTPAAVLDGLMDALSASAVAPATVIQVGQEPKVFTAAEMAAFQAQSKRLGKVQFNTSGVRDRALEAAGAAEYSRALDEAWERFYRENGPGDISLRRLAGVEGVGGIEGAWKDLCEGKVTPGIGIVVDL